jgi:hypothetical protein
VAGAREPVRGGKVKVTWLGHGAWKTITVLVQYLVTLTPESTLGLDEMDSSVSGDIRITEILYRLENACGQTKILFWVKRKSVVVPEILESILYNKQRFCGRSRSSGPMVCVKQRFCASFKNSGIVVLGQTVILWSFQKF